MSLVTCFSWPCSQSIPSHVNSSSSGLFSLLLVSASNPKPESLCFPPLFCPAQAVGMLTNLSQVTWEGEVYTTKAGIHEELLVNLDYRV